PATPTPHTYHLSLHDALPISPQEQWLRTELTNNTKKCTLAYWHRPRFNSSGSNNLAAVKPLWDALYAYSADVVVNAHSEVYERLDRKSTRLNSSHVSISYAVF